MKQNIDRRRSTKMKKIFALLCIVGMTLPALAASDKAALDQRLENARTVIDEIMQTPDKGIPDSIVRQATCIAVIPSVKKGAFIVGAEYGQGVVTCRTGRGWSGPVFIRMAGGSFGFQIGGEGTDLVLVAMNDKGLQDLLKSKFKIGGDASAAAGPVGRNAEASTDISLRAELLTYSRSRGLFAGIDLGGATVSQNTDDTTLLYGAPHTFDQILKGNALPPEDSRPFLRTIAKYFHASQTQSGF
jgi:lipid-binding SYLF domain-containing protein